VKQEGTRLECTHCTGREREFRKRNFEFEFQEGRSRAKCRLRKGHLIRWNLQPSTSDVSTAQFCSTQPNQFYQPDQPDLFTNDQQGLFWLLYQLLDWFCFDITTQHMYTIPQSATCSLQTTCFHKPPVGSSSQSVQTQLCLFQCPSRLKDLGGSASHAALAPPCRILHESTRS
jgi:hypothetical protein